MQRHPQWRARLAAALDDLSTQPFVWGSRDCLTGLFQGALGAVTNTDATLAWRGRYRSARGAVRVMRADGHADLASLVSSLLPEIDPDAAQLGDIAAIPSGDSFGYGLGIVTGETITAFGPDGPAHFPRAAMTRAFKVGA